MNKFDSTFLIVMETESATSQAAVRMGAPVVGTLSSLESLREHLQCSADAARLSPAATAQRPLLRDLLFRFDPEAIETFLKIEQPSPTGGLPEGDNYETIGQFYHAIKRGFRELSATLGGRMSSVAT